MVLADDARSVKSTKIANVDHSFVTILFTDLVDSSDLLTRHGDERADEIRRKHFAVLREAITVHGGREVKGTGDGLMVAFSSAVSAVRCAVAMQRTSKLGMRIGIDAGEPVEDGQDLFGTCVVVASRLCDASEAGQILVSDIVRQIAAPRVEEGFAQLGPLRLKGIAEPVGAAVVEWSGPRVRAEPAHKIKVLIADDQELVRAGFAVIVNAAPDMVVVAEAGDGRQAIELCDAHEPDVVLMDIRMPELDGLEAAERLLKRPGAPNIVLLTTFDLDEYVYRALRIGASGFLLKDAPSNRMLDAVRAAAAGDSLIEPSITRRLIDRFTEVEPRGPRDQPRELQTLTDRELDVLRHVARGLSNAEIAAELVVAESTVKTHVARVLMKLGLRDRVQAVVYAYENRVVMGTE